MAKWPMFEDNYEDQVCESRDDSYERFVKSKLKPGQAIVNSLEPGDVNSLLNILRLASIFGGDVDIAKKRIIYRKDLNRVLSVEGNLNTNELKLTPEQADLIHNLIGMIGEVGEIALSVYASISNDIPLDTENLLEELGDFEFYTTGFRQRLGMVREQVLNHNINKLSKRYKASYTDQEAILRNDKIDSE